MQFLCLVFLLIAPVYSASRSLSRSTKDGNVNLVEFHIDDVLYGRCTYPQLPGKYVTLLFEERGTEMKAWSGDPRIQDPILEAKTCRSAAITPQILQKSNPLYTRESASELKRRIENLQGEMSLNQNYAGDVSARFLGTLLGLRVLRRVMQNSQNVNRFDEIEPDTPPVSADTPVLGVKDVADVVQTPFKNLFRTFRVPTTSFSLTLPDLRLIRTGVNVWVPRPTRIRVPTFRFGFGPGQS